MSTKHNIRTTLYGLEKIADDVKRAGARIELFVADINNSHPNVAAGEKTTAVILGAAALKTFDNNKLMSAALAVGSALIFRLSDSHHDSQYTGTYWSNDKLKYDRRLIFCLVLLVFTFVFSGVYL